MVMTLYKGPAFQIIKGAGAMNHHSNGGSSTTETSDQHWIVGPIMLISSCASWAGFFILQSFNLKKYPAELSLTIITYSVHVHLDFKKLRIVENSNSIQEREPSGLDALASAAILVENLVDTAESSARATTKHPRHRPGCSCIVCTQPPSGKGRHKPTCTCNVCMTVKRRFKTLMLRMSMKRWFIHTDIYVCGLSTQCCSHTFWCNTATCTCAQLKHWDAGRWHAA